jgi:hypothetical protein
VWKQQCWLVDDEERASAFLDCCFERALELVVISHPQGVKLDTNLRACTFHLSVILSGH